jgi:hypothetical protein
VKAVGLIFLMLGCAASTVGAAGAGQSVAAAQQPSNRSAADTGANHPREADHTAPVADGAHVGKPSDNKQNKRMVSGHKPSSGNASQSKANRRTEVPKSRERSASADSKNSDRPGSAKSAGAGQNGLARNETAKHAPSDRAPSAVRPVAPSLGNVRHRGVNPAIVGGAGNSNTRNTVALDGTHMNRKRIGN